MLFLAEGGLRILFRHRHKKQIDLRLEAIFVQAEVTEVRLEHEVHDRGDLLLAEDENAERRSLAAVARQNLLQQALALLGLQLAFDHRMQQPVHDGEER